LPPQLRIDRIVGFLAGDLFAHFIVRGRLYCPPDPIRNLAVNGIKRNVNQKAQSNHPRSFMGKKSGIQTDRNQRVQRMKTQAASQRIIDWISEQVINIDQHATHHDQKSKQKP